MLIKVSFNNTHARYFESTATEEIVAYAQELWRVVPVDAIKAILPNVADGMPVDFAGLQFSATIGAVVKVRICGPRNSAPDVLEGVVADGTLYVDGMKVPFDDYAFYNLDDGPVALCPHKTDSSDNTFVVWK